MQMASVDDFMDDGDDAPRLKKNLQAIIIFEKKLTKPPKSHQNYIFSCKIISSKIVVDRLQKKQMSTTNLILN